MQKIANKGNNNNISVSTKLLAQYALKFSPFDDDDECRICKMLPICGGGCPIDRERYKQNKEEYLCDVAKRRLHEIISRYYGQNFKAKD